MRRLVINVDSNKDMSEKLNSTSQPIYKTRNGYRGWAVNKRSMQYAQRHMFNEEMHLVVKKENNVYLEDEPQPGVGDSGKGLRQ